MAAKIEKKPVKKNNKHQQKVKSNGGKSSLKESKQSFSITYIVDAQAKILSGSSNKPVSKNGNKKNPEVLAMTVIVHYAELVFGRPTTWMAKLDKCQSMYNGLVDPKNSMLFTPQPVDVTTAQFLAYITKFKNSIKKVKNKTGTTAQRDAAWYTLYVTGVKSIMSYARRIIYDHPEWAPLVASALGLDLKNYTNPHTDEFSVKYLRLGTVQMKSKKEKGKRCLFQWQATQNPDNPYSWIEQDIPPTLECKRVVEDLAEGKWYFRLRKVYTKAVAGAWFPIISLMVKNNLD